MKGLIGLNAQEQAACMGKVVGIVLNAFPMKYCTNYFEP